jgi:mRNA interferase RelE/StbE
VAYTVDVLPGAARDLRKLPAKVRTALLTRLKAFRADPGPEDAKKLSGPGGLWRIREGDYRLIYQIRDAELLVLAVRAGHRREVYRHLPDLVKSIPE